MYEQQRLNARDHVLPFIAAHIPIEGSRVLEIGCGEGGVLGPFLERGCTCVGVDLNVTKIEFARGIHRDHAKAGRAMFVASDIYDAGAEAALGGLFDIVILKDTIEHVYDHARILRRIRDFLTASGVLFIGFPPWRMPYGGHQQMTESRLGKLPYYHLLPRRAYRGLLRAFGESARKVDGLMEVVDTRLSSRGLEELLEETGYAVVASRHYLVNPIYRYKFGLKPREQLGFVRALPWVRDFVTTTCYYLAAARD